jgi:hypothetical protein
VPAVLKVGLLPSLFPWTISPYSYIPGRRKTVIYACFASKYDVRMLRLIQKQACKCKNWICHARHVSVSQCPHVAMTGERQIGFG